jgi:cytochrome c oxidase cbb3-type subunit 4
MSSYVDFSHFAQTWGLAFFVVVFAIVLLYALRPAHRDRFADAARMPLRED